MFHRRTTLPREPVDQHRGRRSWEFLANAGSFDNLNWRRRCGLRSCGFQIDCTVEAAMPTASVIARTVYWVASCGGSSCVGRTISATRLGVIGALPGGRDLSKSKLSSLSCMKRSRHRQTQVLDFPVWAMIAEVPRPSPLSSRLARHASAGSGAVPIRPDPPCLSGERPLLSPLSRAHAGAVDASDYGDGGAGTPAALE
jgi:hypothetical protein